jgi:hypothetical protein
MKIYANDSPTFSEVEKDCLSTLTRVSSEKIKRNTLHAETMYWLARADYRIKRKRR